MVRRVFPAKWTTTPPDPGTPADQVPVSVQLEVVVLPPVQVVGVAAKPDRLAKRIALSAMKDAAIEEVRFMSITTVASVTAAQKTGTKLLRLPGPVFVAVSQRPG